MKLPIVVTPPAKADREANIVRGPFAVPTRKSTIDGVSWDSLKRIIQDAYKLPAYDMQDLELDV